MNRPKERCSQCRHLLWKHEFCGDDDDNGKTIKIDYCAIGKWIWDPWCEFFAEKSKTERG